MIFLKLFLTFLEVGTVSFGGGYAMISLMKELVISNGWLTESEMLNIIALSESTPGPIAVNMATFIGSKQGGIFGSFCATLGVVLPAFVIMLTISALIKGFLKYKGVKAFLGGVRPCVVALILSTSVTFLLSGFFGIKNIWSTPSVDFIAIVIFIILVAIRLLTDKFSKKRKISPIIMIVISAFLGMAFYSLAEVLKIRF